MPPPTQKRPQSDTDATGTAPDPAPRRDGVAPRRIALANQKGGVGKTTTAVNLATALAARERVLLLDLDPQGNASTGLGVPRDRRADAAGAYALLSGGAALAEAIRPSAVPGLDLVAADPDLAGAEIELVDADRREHRLADALALGAEALAAYGHVLLDCPPSLGLLTLNALVAADAVLVPLQAEFFALEGVSQITRTLERVRRGGLNPRLELEGIVLTMVDRRNNLSELVAADVRAFFGDRVYETTVPRNVRVSEAPSHGLPVILYDSRSTGAVAHVRLAAELLRRERAAAASTATGRAAKRAAA